MKDKELDPFSTYQENKVLLNSIFMKEKMAKYSKQLVDSYFKSLLRAHKRVEMTRDFLDTSAIQKIIADYLMDMQWHVKYDAVDSDLGSQHRFDLVARKEKRTLLVTIQPKITQKILHDIQSEIFEKKEMPSTRVLVATDVLEAPYILQRGTVADIISGMSRRYRMGILLVDKNMEYQETWLVPSEFLHI